MELDMAMTSVLEHEVVEADNCNETADLEAETCGLCMEIVIDRGLLDCCQHWFCFPCIDNWATITNLCPLCQNEFQLITCVPVYDTVGSNQLEDESFSREDDWCIEEKNNTLSFPSYYIDENAVVCLDGNGCKLRTGSAIPGGESFLDTSIACDSCVIWYHAFCVGFDPEGTTEDTWLCPRCTSQAARESNTNYSETGDSSYQENAASSIQNSFGRKLSVSVADDGETALVVSMVPGDYSDGEAFAIPSLNAEFTKCRTETTQVISKSGGDIMATPVGENRKMLPKLEEEVLELSLSQDASLGVPPCLGASSKLKENSDHLGQDELCINSSQGSPGKINISTISNKSPDSNSDVDPRFEFSMELTSCGELFSDDQATVDPQSTVIKPNSAKRKRANFSDGNEESRAKSKAKVKARYAKRSRPEKKVDSEKHPALNPGDDMAQQKSETSLDIMAIVQGKESKPLKASSLRVKKIMRRPIEDKESSMVVQKLRKEIKEAVRHRSAEELGEKLFNPKLLAAFRAVVTGPKIEQVTQLSPLALKARKSLLQKGKVRESLTKKIYGTSNGKRKRAWDRDCEVEFWKYRCSRTMRPEKIETLKSVLGLLRKDSDNSGTMEESEQNSANSILSRLYLADTSVLPRKNDIKPRSNIEDAPEADQKNAQSISKQSPAVKSEKNSEGGSSARTSASNINRKSASLVKMSANKRTESPVVSSGTLKGNIDSKKETAEKGADVKTDKRKWALEVLARRTASADNGSAGDGDSAVLKGNYPLLAQLPIDTRPTLAPSSHKKIPLSVRQTQLYRLTEHFLKKANLPSICRCAETELAVADAVNIEKTVANRSSSKLVYVNLCSQELLHRSDNTQSNDTQAEPNPSSPVQSASTEKSKEEEIDKPSDPEVEDALRATGLLSDSPPGSPYNKIAFEGEDGQNTDLRVEVPENSLELDSNPELDIYGDFEYDLGDEDYVGATAIKASMPQPGEGESKMKVVFSTFHSDPLENESSVPLKTDNSEGTLPVEDVSEKLSEEEKLSSGEGDEEPSAAECEELYGPEKEPLINKFPEGVSQNEVPGYSKCSDLDKTVQKSGGQSIHEESIGGKESNDASQSRTNSDGKHDKKTSDDVNRQSNGVDHITKKVEAYIKEHIRPLWKSGVISPEQYRWAVSKTTDKVMRYHSKAKNANFLIKEGEKVKRLAEQYVEAAQSRPDNDS